mgnify:CR=1 FL=1
MLVRIPDLKLLNRPCMIAPSSPLDACCVPLSPPRRHRRKQELILRALLPKEILHVSSSHSRNVEQFLPVPLVPLEFHHSHTCTALPCA